MIRSLSIVLPARDEEGNVEHAVRAAFEASRGLDAPVDIVVVDDGSRDGTAAVLERLAGGFPLRVVTHPEPRGYGAALRSGFAAAGGEYVFYTDSDLQFELSGLADAVELIEEHRGVVGYRVDRRDGPLRDAVSATFNGLARGILGLDCRDVNCSFKLFRRDDIQRLELRSDGFSIDTELLHGLSRSGIGWTEVPVPHHARTSGRSSVRLRHAVDVLLGIVALRLKG